MVCYTFSMSNDHEIYALGIELFEKGNYAEAEVLLRDVLKRQPSYADVLNKLGVICHLKGRFKDAAEHFEAALSVNPRYTEASLNLTITYNEMGELERAEQVFMRAAGAVQSSPRALDPFAAGKLANEHFKVGNIYLDFGFNEEAIEEYKKALKLRPGLADILTRLGMAQRSKGLYDEAEGSFKTAIDANPYYSPARVQLGLTYHMKGLPDAARGEWRKALEQNPALKEAEVLLKMLEKEDNASS